MFINKKLFALVISILCLAMSTSIVVNNTSSRYGVTQNAVGTIPLANFDMTANSSGSATITLSGFNTNSSGGDVRSATFLVSNTGEIPFTYDVTIKITTLPTVASGFTGGPGLTINYANTNWSPTTLTQKEYSALGTLSSGQNSSTQTIKFTLGTSIPYTQSSLACTITITAKQIEPIYDQEK